jgi:hypothetical protein
MQTPTTALAIPSPLIDFSLNRQFTLMSVFNLEVDPIHRFGRIAEVGAGLR